MNSLYQIFKQTLNPLCGGEIINYHYCLPYLFRDKVTDITAVAEDIPDHR